MIPQIRLRRHTDGRVALSLVPDRWKCFDNSSTAIPWSPKNEHVSGPGWSELLVAELPEPDSEDPDGRPVWTTDGGVTLVPYIGAVSVGGEELEERRDRGVEVLKTNALKMLAAVATCEQYRAQQEAT